MAGTPVLDADAGSLMLARCCPSLPDAARCLQGLRPERHGHQPRRVGQLGQNRQGLGRAEPQDTDSDLRPAGALLQHGHERHVPPAPPCTAPHRLCVRARVRVRACGARCRRGCGCGGRPPVVEPRPAARGSTADNFLSLVAMCFAAAGSGRGGGMFGGSSNGDCLVAVACAGKDGRVSLFRVSQHGSSNTLYVT